MSGAVAGTSALEARIDRLESHQAITDLASNYCHGFDKRDFERFLSIWWEDCVWDIGPPFGAFSGHDGIREAIHDVLWPAWTSSQHVTSNTVIEFESADRTRAPSTTSTAWDCWPTAPRPLLSAQPTKMS